MKRPIHHPAPSHLKGYGRLLHHIDANHLLVVSLVFALIALLFINTALLAQNSRRSMVTSEVLTQTPPRKVLSSHQTALSEAYEVSIANVATDDTKDPAFALADNETMLILDVTIKNRLQKEVDLFPVNQFYVRSYSGDYATMHASSAVKKPLESGSLLPQESRTGQVSFNIPKTLNQPLLYVDLGWDGYLPVVFDVLR